VGGAAADWYHWKQQEWNAAAYGLFSPEGVLGQIALKLNISWGNYCDAEGANVQSWQK
jgi:hypothetical protein